jgi:hypothetical protein
VTFDSFLTPEGIVVAGGIITTLISVLRTAIPQVSTVNGALLALILSAVLYVLTAVSVGVGSLDAGLTVFAAWLACAATAVAAHEVVTKPVVASVQGGGDA